MPIRKNDKKSNEVWKKKDFSPFKNLKIEDVVINRSYAISINPNDEHQYFGAKSMKERLEKFVDWSKAKFANLLNMHYTLYLEVSPLSRLHWHGEIKYTNIEQLKLFYVMNIYDLKMCSTFEIDTISHDDDKWGEYQRKQQQFWNVVIKHTDRLNKLAIFAESKVVYKKIPEC